MLSQELPELDAFRWPRYSAHRPNRHNTSNKPYLELQKEGKKFQVAQDEGDNESYEASSGSDTEDSEDENGNEPDYPEGEDRNDPDRPLHPVRQFMQPNDFDGGGFEERHLDQEEVVSSFCEQASCDTLHGKKEPRVAIIDIRSNVGVGDDGLGSGVPREQRGGRTANELRKDLEFWLPEQNLPTEVEEDPSQSPDRVLVYLPDMNASAMTVVAEKAPLIQREALMEYFYGHIYPGPSVDVSVNNRGARRYTFHLRIPYVALRWHKTLLEDPRKRAGGKPLRTSWVAECLTPSPTRKASAAKKACFYMAQDAITFCGVNNHSYTVYGTIDTYYDRKSKHSVKRHHKDWVDGDGIIFDPFTGRKAELTLPVWDSRKYFLIIWEALLSNALREFDLITKVLKEACGESCLETSGTGNVVKDFNTWNDEMLRLLDKLIHFLNETIQVWDEFNKTDVGYFRGVEGQTPIIKLYSGLRLRLKSLEALKSRLADINRHEIQSFFGFRTYDAAGKVLGLTVITCFFAPFTQVTGLFNMQLGVLPFEGSPRTFALALLVCVLAYLTVCGLVFWHGSWSGLVGAGLRKVFARTSSGKAATPKTSPRNLASIDRPPNTSPNHPASVSNAGPAPARLTTLSPSASTPPTEVDIGTREAFELEELSPCGKKNLMARMVSSRDRSERDLESCRQQ